MARLLCSPRSACCFAERRTSTSLIGFARAQLLPILARIIMRSKPETLQTLDGKPRSYFLPTEVAMYAAEAASAV